MRIPLAMACALLGAACATALAQAPQTPPPSMSELLAQSPASDWRSLDPENTLYLDLPASVELEITYTEPGLQGDRSTGGTKPATVETGLQIQVPLFLTTGEKVKVDTRTGDYLGRVGA